MTSRVAFIVLGIVIALTLGEVFGVSQRTAILIGLIPFALAEARGLVGPYETSARDMMYDSSDSDERK